MTTKGKTFIVSGPSGVGKSTVLKALLEKENARAGHFRPGLLCRWTDALAAKRRG